MYSMFIESRLIEIEKLNNFLIFKCSLVNITSSKYFDINKLHIKFNETS